VPVIAGCFGTTDTAAVDAPEAPFPDYSLSKQLLDCFLG
jgi:hypothetical protein